MVQTGVQPDAVIYLANDTRTARPVEVRLPRSEGWLHRVQIGRLVSSPYAAPILDLHAGEGQPFVVLELLPSQSLSEWRAERGAADVLAALLFACRLSDLLVECHRVGLAVGIFHPDHIRVGTNGMPLFDLSGVGIPPVAPDNPFRAPEEYECPEGDIYSFARLVAWLVTGNPQATAEAIGERLASAAPSPARLATPESPLATALELWKRSLGLPEERPTARQTRAAWWGVIENLSASEPSQANPIHPDRTTLRPFDPALEEAQFALVARKLGRFELLAEIGRGGMGAVYRARDTSDGSLVAVKIIHREHNASADLLQRFRKEARILALLDSPRIARLIEINEDEGVPYLAMELAAGVPLGRYLREHPRLDEERLLALALEMARALAEAHERGIIHRDFKPSNVLVDDSGAAGPARIKLLDFGLARQIVQSDSMELTKTGAVIGTPTYMAPEQCRGNEPIGPYTDVYSFGIILYQMLAGTPPFVAAEPVKLVAMHCMEKPPPLRAVRADASDALLAIVDKCLAKRPEARFPDARALYHELDLLARGEPTLAQAHPTLPPYDPANLYAVEWTWDLRAPPARLWPFVSNSQRINRAVGVPPVEYETKGDADSGFSLNGRFRMGGFRIEWLEHPFEWIEGRRMAILREFHRGPFQWFLSVVELEPGPNGGTRLRHSVKIAPKNWLGRLVAAREVSAKGRGAVDRVYRSIDEKLSASPRLDPMTDLFEPRARMSAPQRRRLEDRLASLRRAAANSQAVEVLGEFIAAAPAIELGRIRPLEFAQRFTLHPDATVEVFLRATQFGIVELLWDILCPKCRVAADLVTSLREIAEHAHCDVCGEDFSLDLSSSIEMIFRSHPEIRIADTRTYCLGGPDHLPHVAAQLRLAPRERMEAEMLLDAGEYTIRGPRLRAAIPLRVEKTRGVRRIDIAIGASSAQRLPVLWGGGQVITFTNESEREQLVRVERVASRRDAVTAAKAASLPLFRELFPNEVLAPGRLVSVTTTTFLAAGLVNARALYERLGDVRAFAVLNQATARLTQIIEEHGGNTVRAERDALLAVFDEPTRAVRAALAMARPLYLEDEREPPHFRFAVHRGPAIALAEQHQLDFFGGSVHQTRAWLRRARSSEVVVSDVLAADPAIALVFHEHRLVPRVVATPRQASAGGPAVAVRVEDRSAVRRAGSLTAQIDREGRVAGHAVDRGELAP